MGLAASVELALFPCGLFIKTQKLLIFEANLIEEVFDFVAFNLGHESPLIIIFRNLNKIFRLKLKSTIYSIRLSKQIQNQD